MKKFRLLLIMAMLFFAVSLFAQDTTSVTIDYVTGWGFIDFIKGNSTAIIAASILIIEAYIGKSEKIQENSLLMSIWGLLKKLFIKK